MVQDRTQRYAVRLRPTGGGESPIAVQGLAPLAVQHVTFTARDALDGVGTHEAAEEATGLQGLKPGKPLEPRGCPGDGLETAIHQAVGEGVESRGVGATGPHDLLIFPVGYTGDDRMGTNVDAGGVGGDFAHIGERTRFALGGAGARTLPQAAHGGLLCRTRCGYYHHARSSVVNSGRSGGKATSDGRMHDREPAGRAGHASPLNSRDCFLLLDTRVIRPCFCGGGCS